MLALAQRFYGCGCRTKTDMVERIHDDDDDDDEEEEKKKKENGSRHAPIPLQATRTTDPRTAMISPRSTFKLPARVLGGTRMSIRPQQPQSLVHTTTSRYDARWQIRGDGHQPDIQLNQNISTAIWTRRILSCVTVSFTPMKRLARDERCRKRFGHGLVDCISAESAQWPRFSDDYTSLLDSGSRGDS